MKATYLKLDYEGINKVYPKSVQKVIEWFCSREDIIEGLMGMDGNTATKDEIKAAFTQIVPTIIQHDPRKLYEFFDDQKIVIYIEHLPDSDNRFVYHNSKVSHSHPADDRIEAERGGFIDAFDVLEKELSGKKEG